jgi:hypothetical protein
LLVPERGGTIVHEGACKRIGWAFPLTTVRARAECISLRRARSLLVLLEHCALAGAWRIALHDETSL